MCMHAADDSKDDGDGDQPDSGTRLRYQTMTEYDNYDDRSRCQTMMMVRHRCDEDHDKRLQQVSLSDDVGGCAISMRHP